MTRSERRHNNKKWKKRRKNHFGAKCHRPKCGICSTHKRFPKSSKFDNKKIKIEKEILKTEINDNNETEN